MKKRFSEEQIIDFSRRSRCGAAGQGPIPTPWLSEASCCQWRSKFGRMKACARRSCCKTSGPKTRALRSCSRSPSLSSHMDLAKAVRPGRAVQRVNVDFPVDLLREIDQEARRLGVTRQAFIKVRLADSLVKSTS